MSTARQAQASRHNGAKSNGPVTEAGRKRSAQNSLRHGLCARKFELRDPQDQKAFDALEADLLFTWKAVEDAQKAVVRQIAVAMWRLKIVDAMEMALMDGIMDGEATALEGGLGLPSLNSIYRYRGRIEREMKQAQERLRELQAERAAAFERQLEKAREFSHLTQRNALIEAMGEQAFDLFRQMCTNEPDNHPTSADLSGCAPPQSA